MSERRTLGVREQLPERLTGSDRIAHMDADVREAAAKARARIYDNIRAKGYPEVGYTVDEDSWNTAIIGRSLLLTVSIERP